MNVIWNSKFKYSRCKNGWNKIINQSVVCDNDIVVHNLGKNLDPDSSSLWRRLIFCWIIQTMSDILPGHTCCIQLFSDFCFIPPPLCVQYKRVRLQWYANPPLRRRGYCFQGTKSWVTRSGNIVWNVLDSLITPINGELKFSHCCTNCKCKECK